MKTDFLLSGMLKGMQSMGAIFVRNENNVFYFDVKKGSEIDNSERLQRSKDTFMKTYGITLEIRRID